MQLDLVFMIGVLTNLLVVNNLYNVIYFVSSMSVVVIESALLSFAFQYLLIDNMKVLFLAVFRCAYIMNDNNRVLEYNNELIKMGWYNKSKSKSKNVD